MRIVFYLLVAGVAAVVSLGFSILIYRLSLRFRLYPKIRERDVHTRPTPRLGGIAMFLGVVVAFAVGSQLPQLSLVFQNTGQIYAILGATLLIVLLGVADDIWDLDWLTKLAGQFIAAGILAWQGVVITSIPVPGSLVILPSVMAVILTVFAVVLVMNAINFIDGLDGLVAGVAIIANTVFFIYAYVISYGPTAQSDYFNLAQFISAALIGACIGFLPLNWHPARMFMGDAGALLVGLLMATSAIAVTGQIDPGRITGQQGPGGGSVLGASGLVPAYIPIILPFAVLLLPLLDFALAVFRRLKAGKSPFSADRKHIHHRLLDMGHTHFQTVLIFYAWTAAAAIGCLLFLFVDWWWALAFLVIALAICGAVTFAPLGRKKEVASGHEQ